MIKTLPLPSLLHTAARLRSNRLGGISLLAGLGFAGLAGIAAGHAAWPAAMLLGSMALTYGVGALARG